MVLWNVTGNHDHDGATPCDENTDFNSAAKYRNTYPVSDSFLSDVLSSDWNCRGTEDQGRAVPE